MEKVTPFITKKLAHKFFFYPVEYSYPDVELEWLKKAKMETFKFNDHDLMAYHWGNTQSENKILLVHGWAGRATQFWKFIEKLDNEYHIISFDAPGHGKSEGKTTSLPEIASIINNLRQEYKINYLSGHSLGGAACVYALKEQPETLEKLILISAPTKANLMLDDFLYKLNAGDRTKKYVKQMVKNSFGFPLDYYFAESILPLDNFPETLAFHDHNDTEVSFEHLNQLRHSLDKIHTVETSLLGHTKILRNNLIVNRFFDFLQ